MKVGRLDVLLMWRFISKKGLIPWTEIIMGDECSIWVAKHIFPRTLWFLRNWQGLYPLGPNKCYPIALLYDIKFGITFLSFIYNPSQYISEELYFFFILPIITICFTCGETKSLSNIKISQNIMTRIVWKAFFCILCLNSQLQLLKTVIFFGCNLLYLSRKHETLNFKGFWYQIWTSVKRSEK